MVSIEHNRNIEEQTRDYRIVYDAIMNQHLCSFFLMMCNASVLLYINVKQMCRFNLHWILD